MNRILLLFCSLLLTSVLCIGSNGNAGKHIKWELKNGVLSFSGEGEMKDFGKERPYREDLVTHLTVGEGITSIGENAFRNCTKLISAELPSSLKKINEDSFLDCVSLSDINIPFGVESIGSRAFKGCVSLIELQLPISVRILGEESFAGCTNLINARLTQSIESMGKDAFHGCKILATLSDLPSFVTTSTFATYGLNRAAVKNYWDRKEEIAARFGNASGFLSDSKSQTTTMEPADVDLEIPYTGINNANTFALIIANENYGKLSNVPFAVNDGNTFARYCQRTLGVPTKNILQYNDASYGSIREALSDIRLINDVVGNDMKLIVYYAGHGAPDDATLEPYLRPVDAARVNKDVCIPMAQFYQEIGSMKLKSATVFLDACFSGATRDGNMVIAARGIARVPKKQGLKGRVAVLSATSDDQTALPYNEKGHGMFTYYLLKCLKETKGEASLQDIKEYVTDNVKRNSSIVNRKEQTPTFNVSTEASSQWNAWKLNN